jgi:hypothetical protein
MEPSQSDATPAPGQAVNAPNPPGAADGNGVTPAHSLETSRGDDEDRPFRGVHVLRIPRPEVGRLMGTLRLSELPRRKPTIVFGSGRRSPDAGDE